MPHLLNPDGTVDLHAAEHELKLAERHHAEACREVRRCRFTVDSTPSYRIEHGRAQQRLDMAVSNADGAWEAVLAARGAVHEALNPNA